MTQALAKIIERSRQERETWRYTDIEKILAKPPVDDARPMPEVAALSTTRLVFINGAWSAGQSTLGDMPREILKGDAATGYTLSLAGQTCMVTHPIELVFRATDAAKENVASRLTVDVGANGRLTLIERHEGSGVQATLPETHIRLAAQSKLVHGKIIRQTAAHLAMTKVTLAEGAYYDNFTLIEGNPLTRNEIDVQMQGEQAQCALNGVMLLDGTAHADTRTCITHAAPHGVSQQYYKTIADGKSHGVFQGKVVVAKGAQKTDSKQMSRALLLSDQAEVDAKPELEIYADDVKCSHGSTVGDLDAEALFYMRARGVPEAEARALLMRAFAEELVDQIQMPEWRDACRLEIERWLDARV